MKKGTIANPKTKDLAARLGRLVGAESLGSPALGLWMAVGVLESLWHFAAEYAKPGDIGRFTDAQIAAAVDWKGDPSAFVAALVESRWLDAHPRHRLVVHDWPEHCEDSIHKSLARAGLKFASGKKPSLSRLEVKERERLEQEPPSRRKRTPGGRPADALSTACPSPAQPKPSPCLSPAQPSPAQAPPDARPEPVSGSGGSEAARVGAGVGGPGGRGLALPLQRIAANVGDAADAERALQVQAILARAGVNANVQAEFVRRRDVTPARLESELRSIREANGVVDVAGVLVSRLRKPPQRARAPA